MSQPNFLNHFIAQKRAAAMDKDSSTSELKWNILACLLINSGYMNQFLSMLNSSSHIHNSSYYLRMEVMYYNSNIFSISRQNYQNSKTRKIYRNPQCQKQTFYLSELESNSFPLFQLANKEHSISLYMTSKFHLAVILPN